MYILLLCIWYLHTYMNLTCDIYIYIVIHSATVSLYHNFSVWLDTWDITSWLRNPADFTSVGYFTPNLSYLSAKAKELYVYIHLNIRLSVTVILSSWEEFYIYAYVLPGYSTIERSTQLPYIYGRIFADELAIGRSFFKEVNRDVSFHLQMTVSTTVFTVSLPESRRVSTQVHSDKSMFSPSVNIFFGKTHSCTLHILL